MSVFTDREETILRNLKAIECEPDCGCTVRAREIADHVRRECPDLTDATLARVIVATAAPVSYFAQACDLSGEKVAGTLGAAAVDLATLHLD